jgi:hypothetical protein
LFKIGKVTLGIRKCDKLDGAPNFVPWKLKLHILMEEPDIWEHVEKEIPKPIGPTK